MTTRFQFRKAYATYIIAAINIVLFLFASVQGEEAVRSTYEGMAVAVPQDFSSIEWLKLLAANFFHISAVHLIINMVGICFFGPFLEFALGVKRYLALYLTTGFVAMLMLLIYSWIFNQYVPALRIDPADPQITAGASACMMGIVGAHAAIFLRMWLKEGSALARNHYFFMALLVLLQIFVDLRMLTVAFGGHLTGAVLGFVLALILGHYPLDLSKANPFSLAGAERRTEGGSE